MTVQEAERRYIDAATTVRAQVDAKTLTTEALHDLEDAYLAWVRARAGEEQR